MASTTTMRSCGECEFHETSLTILMEGAHSFPGVEFRCRQKFSSHVDRVVKGPEAERCPLFAAAVRRYDVPL
ncbi:MAG: hypothetical protein HY712_02480 [candidate division NC10 bacterium]|nr:hypothetical protein [candidate division NC10 bacterium]